MIKKVIVMTAVLLTLAACENQKTTAMLDTDKANWDVIASSSEGTKTGNGFLIMMR
jgi:hypothetical protein